MEAEAARGTVEVREDIRRVMVAIDEHEGSFYALEWALKNLHESIINSNLVIFTAQPSSEYSYIHALEPREMMREVQEDQKKTAASLLENAREICIKHGGFSWECQQLLCSQCEMPGSCGEETLSYSTKAAEV